MTLPDPTLLVQHPSEAVQVWILNRPSARNALNIELTSALAAAFAAFDNDDSARVAILTGRDPAFCAGLDLKMFSDASAPRSTVGEVLRGFPKRRKPVIGAINGPAMTGGLELALGCDFLIASERALFGDTHLKVGAMGGGGINSRLPHAVGARWSRQLTLTAIPITAETARQIGLVNEVVPHDRLLPRALELAQAIAAHHPALVQRTRGVLEQASEGSLQEALRVEADALAAYRASGPESWNKVLK